MPTAQPHIADALVLTACAYTSLRTLEEFGLLDRERALYARLFPRFGRIVLVTYGAADAAIAPSLAPPGYAGRIDCICNHEELEPARFLAGVPGRVAALLAEAHTRTALVKTDQFFGGDVAVAIARALRTTTIRTGLLARAGYHWSWTVAREDGPDSPQAAIAAMLESELCHAADFVIATTPRIIDDLAYRHALPRQKLRVVPNFIISDHPPTPIAQRTPGLVLTAGRLNREKRPDLIIRAIAALPPRSRSSAHLLVVGQGPLLDELRSLARSLNVSAEFRPRLPHRDLLSLMHRCRVYMQCSEYEGHPKTILEAMASGAPVLATRSPGIDSQIIDNTSGLLRDPAPPAPPNPSALASALDQLLTDDTLANRLGTTAAAHTRALALEHTFPLLIDACASAMALASEGATLPRTAVRWDQTLLRLPPSDAAAEFASSIAAFSKRLDPASRMAFLTSLEASNGFRQAQVNPAL